jgi:hypothetical protein
MPAQSSMLAVSGLPIGQVTITADAFAATCATVGMTSPNWVSHASIVTLVPGSPVSLTLSMHRPGQVSVSVDFPSPDGGVPSQPTSASETVNAGGVATSQSFKMVYTFGQPAQNQDRSTSATLSLRGGLQGANGSQP